MKVWEIYTVRDNNLYLTGNEEELEKLFPYYFDGEVIGNQWDSSLELYIEQNEDIETDVPMFSDSYFIVNDKALQLFVKLAGEEIECLDFICKYEKYVIINPIDVVDCLDLEKSEYKVYKGNPNTIQSYKRLCFKSEKLIGKNLFRIQHCDGCLLACSNELKESIEEKQIKGLGFKLLDEC